MESSALKMYIRVSVMEYVIVRVRKKETVKV